MDAPNTLGPEHSITLLAIDDDAGHLDFVVEALSSEELRVIVTTEPEEGLRIVRRTRPQIVLLDLTMPKLSGMEMLERILDIDPNADVVILTGNYSTESAVEAVQKGACDYLNKPVSVETLRGRVSELAANTRRHLHQAGLRKELGASSVFEGMVGVSPLMQELFVLIQRIAPHFQTTLVTGATGTGKELVARALHRGSPAAKGPFAVCNCAAIADSLLESELFGHVKGSFTGATQDRVGLFEYANGGVLLLDEVGEMPLSMQAKLLRVLQNREVQRVGSPVPRKIDVRIIAATHRDLRKLVAQGRFREDLYYRLAMVEIKVPSLAERREDLPLLLNHFLQHFAKEYSLPVCSITRRAQILLTRHAWPGNVRELENILGNACMLAQEAIIDVRDLPESLKTTPCTSASDDNELLPMAEMQRRHLLRVLNHVKGNKVQAAEILQLARSTLYRMLEELEATTEPAETVPPTQ